MWSWLAPRGLPVGRRSLVRVTLERSPTVRTSHLPWALSALGGREQCHVPGSYLQVQRPGAGRTESVLWTLFSCLWERDVGITVAFPQWGSEGHRFLGYSLG